MALSHEGMLSRRLPLTAALHGFLAPNSTCYRRFFGVVGDAPSIERISEHLIVFFVHFPGAYLHMFVSLGGIYLGPVVRLMRSISLYHVVRFGRLSGHLLFLLFSLVFRDKSHYNPRPFGGTNSPFFCPSWRSSITASGQALEPRKPQKLRSRLPDPPAWCAPQRTPLP